MNLHNRQQIHAKGTDKKKRFTQQYNVYMRQFNTYISYTRQFNKHMQGAMDKLFFKLKQK